MGKKKGIEAASAQLQDELARIDQLTQRVVEGVEAEAGKREDQYLIRDQLGALRQQVGQFAANASPLLERARSAAERAEHAREITEEIASALETVVAELVPNPRVGAEVQSGLDTINPDNWKWDDGDEEQREIRHQLVALHRQAHHLAQNSSAFLERAAEAMKRAELKRDLAEDFASNLETLIDGITSASDAVDPDNWEWET